MPIVTPNANPDPDAFLRVLAQTVCATLGVGADRLDDVADVIDWALAADPVEDYTD